MAVSPPRAAGSEPWQLAVRALGWMLVLLVVLLTTPGPTAVLLSWMLSCLEIAVVRHGTTLVVEGLAPRVVNGAWCAWPVVVVGVSVILAQPAAFVKQCSGALFLAGNALVVNLLVLSLVASTTDADVPGLMTSLRVGYPLLMGLVLAVCLLYWFKRVLPEDLGPNLNVGHARELLGASPVTRASESDDGARGCGQTPRPGGRQSRRRA